MKKIKVYSVRLQNLTTISDKCYKATAFDGSEALIPKSQVFGRDYDVQKSDAYWISAWILEQKNIQYSQKKEGWYNPSTMNVEAPYYLEVAHHKPEQVAPIKNNSIPELKK